MRITTGPRDCCLVLGGWKVRSIGVIAHKRSIKGGGRFFFGVIGTVAEERGL